MSGKNAIEYDFGKVVVTSFCRPASGPVPKGNTFFGLIYFIFNFKQKFSNIGWLFCSTTCSTHTHTSPPTVNHIYLQGTHTHTRSTHISGAHNTHSNTHNTHSQGVTCPGIPGIYPSGFTGGDIPLYVPMCSASLHDTIPDFYY